MPVTIPFSFLAIIAGSLTLLSRRYATGFVTVERRGDDVLRFYGDPRADERERKATMR